MEKMIPDPQTYFRHFIPPRDSLLEKLEAEAEAEEIPIVGPVVGGLLSILVQATGARRILELGTATGYSTLYLLQGCAAVGGKVVTIEMDADFAARAEKTFATAGEADRVEIVVSPAEDALKTLEDSFDMVFMDIDKEFYASALPDCHRLLRPAGLLIADNTAFNDSRPFNRQIFESRHWHSVQLYSFLPSHSPENDGLCLAIRS